MFRGLTLASRTCPASHTGPRSSTHSDYFIVRRTVPSSPHPERLHLLGTSIWNEQDRFCLEHCIPRYVHHLGIDFSHHYLCMHPAERNTNQLQPIPRLFSFGFYNNVGLNGFIFRRCVHVCITRRQKPLRHILRPY